MKSAHSPARALISSTSQRGRPTPGTGNVVDGSALTRQRVTLAVGCPKSAASAARRQRRMAIASVPDPSAASCSRRDAVIGNLATSPTTPASPPWRKPSSKQASTVFSSPTSA